MIAIIYAHFEQRHLFTKGRKTLSPIFRLPLNERPIIPCVEWIMLRRQHLFTLGVIEHGSQQFNRPVHGLNAPLGAFLVTDKNQFPRLFMLLDRAAFWNL
jgi:hypothetical protein